MRCPFLFTGPTLLVAAVFSCAGCSRDSRLEVSGQVKFNGQPIPAGVIFFDPDITKGNDGPGGFAYIKDGAYDTRKDGRGVVGGPHRVRIQGFDGKPGQELPMGQPLFPEYELTADLPKSDATHDFDVPASARKRP